MFGLKKNERNYSKKPEKDEIRIEDPAEEDDSKNTAENERDKENVPEKNSMKNKISEEEIYAKLNKGFLRSRILFEMIGKPKEHIEETIEKYILEIENDSDVILLSKHIAPVTDLEDGMFSTFAEIEILAKNATILVNFCYLYMPASIEVIEPERLDLANIDFNSFFNDLLLKLHDVSIELKKTMGKVRFLEDNTTKLIYNLIILSLKNAPKTIDEIYDDVRIEKKDLEDFMAHLSQINVVEKKDERYSLKTQLRPIVSEKEPEKETGSDN